MPKIYSSHRDQAAIEREFEAVWKILDEVKGKLNTTRQALSAKLPQIDIEAADPPATPLLNSLATLGT